MAAVTFLAAGAAVSYLVFLSTRVALFTPAISSSNPLHFMFFLPLVVFAIAYARLLCDSSVETRQRWFALILNCSGALIIAAVLWLRFGPLVQRVENESSVLFEVAYLVGVPILFILVSAVILSRRKYRYVVASVAAVLVWPYLACAILICPLVTAWTGSVYAVLVFTVLISPLLFLFAAVTLFYRPRIGYGIGLAAGLLALIWLGWTELLLSPWANSWIALNGSDRFEAPFIFPAELKILTTALVLFAVFRVALGFLPARWILRGRPIAERVWPAVAITALALAGWFSWAARPYRLPGMIDKGPVPTLRILRVEKKGLQFHETFVSTSRDGRFWISRDHRRLFQYQFQKDTIEGEVPPAVEQDVTALVQSPQLQNLQAPLPEALRSWDAEGWYVITARPGILAFTTEHKTVPPSDVVRVFQELEALAPTSAGQEKTRDVCLGFCYDPLAGLGFAWASDRCHYSPTGIECR